MQNQERDIYSNVSPYHVPAAKEKELYAQIKAFGIKSITHNEIEYVFCSWRKISSCEYLYHMHRVVSHLGSGQFGSVDQGVWRRPNDSAVDVALKTLNEGASEQDKVRFLQEGAIMAQFRHPNIVSLYGIIASEFEGAVSNQSC